MTTSEPKVSTWTADTLLNMITEEVQRKQVLLDAINTSIDLLLEKRPSHEVLYVLSKALKNVL